jgi:hypothetical protein
LFELRHLAKIEVGAEHKGKHDCDGKIQSRVGERDQNRLAWFLGDSLDGCQASDREWGHVGHADPKVPGNENMATLINDHAGQCGQNVECSPPGRFQTAFHPRQEEDKS